MINNKSIDWFPARKWIGDVNTKTVRADLIAGLTGAVIVLPQGVAFAMIAGLPPIYGLYTAMILPIVAALFGSSKHLISGPTTAISLVVFSTVSQYAEPTTPEFISIAIVVTLVVGVIQLLLGILRFGAVINFVSHSVIIGFTAGAAVLIATSQIKYLIGINVPRGSSFLETWFHLFKNINDINPILLGIGLGTLILAILIKRIHAMAPHLLTAMIIFSFFTYYFFGGEPSIRLVGQLPQGLPQFSLPNFNFEQLTVLSSNAFAIALLGLIESVAIGRSIAVKSGQRINSNQEFIGQGLSNIVGSFFSSYAGAGSFTRSGINYSAGAKTPLASIFAATFLMLVIYFVAPLAAYLPITVMGGVIILVAYNLIDFKHIKKLVLNSRGESLVMIVTFLATLFIELEYAIYLGVFFSLILYLRQTGSPKFVEVSPDASSAKNMFLNVDEYNLETCPQLMIYRMEGSLFFGSVDHVADEMDALFSRPEKYLILVANNINLIDHSGAEYLASEVKKWSNNGKQIYFSGLKQKAHQFLNEGGYLEEIGKSRFYSNKQYVIKKVYSKLDHNICCECSVQLFRECPKWVDHGSR